MAFGILILTATIFGTNVGARQINVRLALPSSLLSSQPKLARPTGGLSLACVMSRRGHFTAAMSQACTSTRLLSLEARVPAAKAAV